MELPVITDDMMRAGGASAKPYVAVILHRTPAYGGDTTEATVWEHGRRNYALRAAGLLSIVCPIRDESDVAGLAIINGDPAQIRELMDADPGVQAGIFSYELHPCRSFPGDRLP